jgi:magnesium transporter
MHEKHVRAHVHAVEALLDRRDWQALRRLMADMHNPEVARVLLELTPAAGVVLFRLLPTDRASRIFAELDHEEQNIILTALSDEETRNLLESLKPDERTELFDEMPSEVTRRLFSLLTPEDLAETRKLLGYPPESVGRIMTPDYMAIERSWTVARALGHIKQTAASSETITMLYVRDADWTLVGRVDLGTLILARPDQRIEDIMRKKVAFLHATDDQEHAVSMMQKYDLSVLPVVDGTKKLLGIVTFDDVFDVAEEETTEDFHMASAIAPLDTSYALMPVHKLYRRRIGWLAALVGLNIASSGVIAAYEETLEAAITLAFFIPLLIDSGGNTGAQSATLMIRALSIGDVTVGNWLRTLTKELSVAVLLGVTLAILGAGLGILRGGPIIGVIVGITMILIILVTNTLGSILPFVLSRFRIDPAVASGPLITSVADVVGLMLYFTVANALLF